MCDAGVSIVRDGRVFYFSDHVTPHELLQLLRRDRSLHSETIARIHADRRAPFGQVRMVVLAARDAGFARVTFMVDPPDSR